MQARPKVRQSWQEEGSIYAQRHGRCSEWAAPASNVYFIPQKVGALARYEQIMVTPGPPGLRHLRHVYPFLRLQNVTVDAAQCATWPFLMLIVGILFGAPFRLMLWDVDVCIFAGGYGS